MTTFLVLALKGSNTQIKRSDIVTSFTSCSHYYRSKAIGRTMNLPARSLELVRPCPALSCPAFCSDPFYYSASALLAMQSAVLARGIPSVCLSVRHVPALCPDERRYDHAVFSVWQDNPSSFWRGKVYPDIRRESPPAGA